MKLCPRCGAPNHDQTVNCHYCGIQFSPPPQQQPPAYWNQSLPSQTPPVHHRTAKSSIRIKPQPKKNTVWKILGWLFVFPLMVTLTARKKKTRAWYIAAAISWILYLIVFGPWNRNTPSKQPAVKNAVPVSQEQMIETMMAQMMLTWTATPSPTSLPTLTVTFWPTSASTPIPTILPLPTSAPAFAAPAIKNAAPAADTSDCNPNYDPCIPNTGNVTCKSLGIKNIRVIGVDVYDLDKDKDGFACEKN